MKEYICTKKQRIFYILERIKNIDILCQMGINLSTYNLKTRIFCKIIKSDMCKRKKKDKCKMYMCQNAGVGPGLLSCVGTFSSADRLHAVYSGWCSWRVWTQEVALILTEMSLTLWKISIWTFPNFTTSVFKDAEKSLVVILQTYPFHQGKFTFACKFR